MGVVGEIREWDNADGGEKFAAEVLRFTFVVSFSLLYLLSLTT